MSIRGREIAGRTIAAVIGLVLLALLMSITLYQCDKRRDEKAQGKVDSAQSDAATNSAADAINTVSEAGQRETASEELTRDNDREIRAAEGAAERVKPGVDYAGRRALCKRPAYVNDPKCKVFRQ
jgi:uncharacterized protein YdbL (DUF1318 family)